MANNCLVKVIKKRVDNDNLFYLNKIKFVIDNNEATNVFSINSACTAELGEGVTLLLGDTTVGVGPVTVELTSGAYKALGTGQFLLSNYTSVTSFSISYTNNAETLGAIKAIAYMPSLTNMVYNAISAPNETFDFSLKQQGKKVLTKLIVYGGGLSTIQHLKEFAKIFDAQYIQLGANGTWGFTGLADFAEFPSLTTIDIGNNCPGFAGTIENMVSAFVSKGRVTDSIQLAINNSGPSITFEGNQLGKGKWLTVSWDGVDNITVADTPIS